MRSRHDERGEGDVGRLEDEEEGDEREPVEGEEKRLADDVAGNDDADRSHRREEHRDDLERFHQSSTSCDSRCLATRAIACVSTPFSRNRATATKSAFHTGAV